MRFAIAPQVIQFGGCLVGDGHPPLVVAEVGINHNGDVNLAKLMVKTAKAAGAHCIKFQTHITRKEMIPTDMTPGRISAEPLWNIIERCELTEVEEREIKWLCDESGILFLSTPFSREAADRLERLDVPAYKDVKLGAIPLLQQRFGVPVGLSDHSMGIYTALGAVAKGACVLEKHFTISRSWPGPDQGMSIEPDELRELVQGAEAIYQALGADKVILEQERPVIGFARASVVVVKPIAAGERLTEDNIWVKRPADGEIPAKAFNKVIGKTAKIAMAPDHQLKWSEVE